MPDDNTPLTSIYGFICYLLVVVRKKRRSGVMHCDYLKVLRLLYSILTYKKVKNKIIVLKHNINLLNATLNVSSIVPCSINLLIEECFSQESSKRHAFIRVNISHKMLNVSFYFCRNLGNRSTAVEPILR